MEGLTVIDVDIRRSVVRPNIDEFSCLSYGDGVLEEIASRGVGHGATDIENPCAVFYPEINPFVG